MTPVLETSRLALHPLALADAEQVQPLFASWDIVRYLNSRVPWPYPADGAKSYYREVVLPAVARGEQWHWTLRLKVMPERIIGGIALMAGGDDNRGFWLGRQWQGQGLMTEACAAITDFWFETLGFPVLRVTKAVANAASRRISEKQKMRLVGTEERDYVSGRLQAEIWEITADEWRSHHKQRKP